jgi:hypothetical protein
MANYNAAFGYDFYIVPLESSFVDVSYSGITAGDAPSTGFIDTSSLITASGQNIVYSPGTSSTAPKFTVGGVDYLLDGAAEPIRLAGLTAASYESDTSSEDIYTYDDDTKGFNQAQATTKAFSLSLAGVADFGDSGYKFLRLAETNTVADNLKVKFLRVGPTGITETIYGYGTLQGYNESNEVASIVSWACTLAGYGRPELELA